MDRFFFFVPPGGDEGPVAAAGEKVSILPKSVFPILSDMLFRLRENLEIYRNLGPCRGRGKA